MVTFINYTYNNDPNNPNDKAGNQVHELAHAFQFFKNVFTQTEKQQGTDDFIFPGDHPQLLDNATQVQAYKDNFRFVDHS